MFMKRFRKKVGNWERKLVKFGGLEFLLRGSVIYIEYGYYILFWIEDLLLVVFYVWLIIFLV